MWSMGLKKMLNVPYRFNRSTAFFLTKALVIGFTTHKTKAILTMGALNRISENTQKMNLQVVFK
jgi:hypothetical protein